MYMIQHQNYIMTSQKQILINTMFYQMQKRSKINLKYDSNNFRIDEYDYKEWCKEKSVDEK